MVVLDTSVIIDNLRKPVHESVLVKLFEKHPKEIFAVSVVSIQELYEGKSTKDETRENHLLSTLGSLTVLGYTTDVAKLAGKIARDLRTPIEFADVAIAATTIANGGELVTLNEKHFKGIANLDLLKY